MKTLVLNKTVKIDNFNQLLNLQDSLMFVCGTFNNNHIWRDDIMQALADLQVKIQK